jgi:acyl carrier protein
MQLEPLEPDIGQSREMARVKAWLLTVNKEAGEVGWDTDLIAEGILDSLQMVNFLLYIEEVRGREIREQMIRPECFQSLRAIYENFFRA